MQVSCEELEGDLGSCAADVDMGILAEGLCLVQGNWPLPRWDFHANAPVELHAAAFGSRSLESQKLQPITTGLCARSQPAMWLRLSPCLMVLSTAQVVLISFTMQMLCERREFWSA